MSSKSVFLLSITCFCLSQGRPSGPTTTTPLIVGRPLGPTTTAPFIAAPDGNQDIILSQMEIVSDIQFRYARTQVTAYFKNPSSVKSQEAKFQLILPEEAFISNLSMILSNGEEFVSKIREKEVAKKEYQEAVSSGSTAGLVSASFKGSNREFTVRSNVEPSGKVRFVVTYEELLPRTRSYYEYGINLDTKNYIIPDFTLTVNINESLPLTHLNVPVILDQSNLIQDAKGSQFLDKNEEAIIDQNVDDDPSKARIFLRISEDFQRNNPLDSSKFVVRYDVDRKEENEIQVIDGYFVHFIVPEESGPVLPKYVVFVLDVSGSMQGEKIEQMKDAMVSIIDELGPQDRFNILTFSDEVLNWIPESHSKESNITSYPATDFYKELALQYILTLVPLSATNINEGMQQGLVMIQDVSNKEEIKYGTAKMLLFLTDGQATSGETDSKAIVSNVVKSNVKTNALIYGLAFGQGADFDLIKTIASSNGGFGRRIHAGVDAALQLENFFSEISSPLFSNLQVKYVGDVAQNVTEPLVSTFFKNQEMIVLGKINNPSEVDNLTFIVNAEKAQDELNKRFTVCLRDENFMIHPDIPHSIFCAPPILPPKSPSQNFIERLWAFKTIKNAILSYTNEMKSEVPNVTEIELNKKKALDLSIAYNFVTPLTSLVVTKETFDLSEDEFLNLSNRVSGIPSGGQLFFSAPNTRVRNTGHRGPPGIPTRVFTTTTFRPRSTSAHYVYDMYDYEDSEEESLHDPVQPNNSSDPSPCSGNVTLFTKTYLRGENLTIALDEVSDLNQFKLVSLNIEGDCCWRIFSERNYGGKSTLFTYNGSRSSDGVFNSASEMGNVFRNANSIRKAVCVL